MQWLIIAIVGYTLLAIESVISKYLLAGRIKSWQVYSFYIGIFSGFGLLIMPFGFRWYGLLPFLISLLSGLVFYGSLIFLYKALLSSSTARVYVLYGATVTVFTTLLSKFVLQEKLTLNELTGILLLISGGIIISYKYYETRFFTNYKAAFFGGLLAAVSLILLKYGYSEQKFVTGYVISRGGIFLGALGSLAFPKFRKALKVKHVKSRRRQNIKNITTTVIAKSIAGVGTLLINLSISLASVAIVSSLVSIQYMLTFVLALILSCWFKHIYVEKFTILNILSKLSGIFFVAMGTILVVKK